MDAMAGASTSVDGLFVPNPGSLASFVSSSAAMAPFHHFSTPTSIIPVSTTRNGTKCVGTFLDHGSKTLNRICVSVCRKRRAA
jgi:hypothetical protein